MKNIARQRHSRRFALDCKWATIAAVLALAGSVGAKEWPGFSVGMGMGGWLTNYKRFNVLPENKRLDITKGDLAHFDTYITEGDVARVKMWGFDHIRLGFDQIVLEEAPGKYRERTMRKLEEFVGWCRAHKVNAVLNLHKAIGNYCDIPEKVQLLDSPELQDRFVALWLEIERRLHDAPEVAFELLNEVRNVDPAKWNRLADRTLKAIREVNPDRWVVIGSTCWNSPGKLAVLQTWDDPRVVYTFHMYAPHHFTHQRGVLQADHLYQNDEVPYPGTAFVRKALKPAVDWAAAHPDKILWNGEFGTIRHANPMARADYMRDVVAVCKEAGIPWCVWNYLSTPNDGNRFSLVDDVTRDFLTEDLQLACLGKGDAAARGELKYMCFNIWGDCFGNPVCERDLKEAGYVLRNAPDIVGMQEVTPNFWKSRLFATLAQDYGVVRNEGNPKAEYNPLLWRKSRLELIEGGTHVYAAQDNPEGSKGFGWGVFRDKATGRTLIAYSAHLWWKWDKPEDPEMRVRNVRELLAKMDALRKKYNCPVVGGGDLNCTRAQMERGLVTPLPEWEKAGFADAQYAVKGASDHSSHHGNPRRDALGNYRGWISPEVGDSRNSLDHVHYTTNGVTPISLVVDRAQDALEVSDHSPVIFTFRLARPPVRLGVSVYDGWLTFPGGRITLTAFLPGWKAVSVKPVKSAADGGARPFTVSLPDGTAAFKGRVGWCARPDGTVAGNVRVECVKAVEMECLALSASVPSCPESGLGDSTVSRYVLPVADGRRIALEFPSPTRCSAQDLRKWSGKWGVRFSGRGNRRKYSPGDVVEWDVALAPVDGAALEFVRGVYEIRERDGWTRIENRRDIEAGSALDFSRMGLQDAPAGKHGWVKSVGGRFEFEALPGKEQRFYGVNLCFSANYPTHELADRLAARLAMCGYNAVRVHHHDGIWKADEDGAREKLDYLLARLFERGIYVTTDLYVSRPVTWREVGIDRDGEMKNSLYKAYIGISDAAFTNWCENAREFLDHVNPYTGRAYKDEPALPLLSLVNEGRLGQGWEKGGKKDDPLVRAAWREFCAEAGLPPEKADEGPGRSPGAGFEEWANRRVWERCSAFVRSTGCRAMLSNDNNGLRHGKGEGLTPLYDYVDSHFYVDHPEHLGKSWSLPMRIRGANPAAYGGPGIFRSGWAKGASKPYTITEWNFCGPGRFRGVGGLLTGAFAAEQEWDGLWRFAYSHSVRGMDCDSSFAVPESFNIAEDPLMAASDRAAVCLYLRGDAEAGSLRLDKEAGKAAVVSPRTCGGFAERGAVEAGALSFALRGESPATVWASSVDAEPTPLSKARRILVAHLTDLQGDGAQFADESRQVVMKWGRGCLVANGRADVTLALDGPSRPKVYALRFDGSRRGEVASTFDGGRLAFVADTARDVADATCLYEIVR